MNEESSPAGEDVRRSRVDDKLLGQLRIFLVIFVAMIVLEVYRLLTEDLRLLPILGGFLAGCVIGVLLVRTKVLGWDASEQRVVGTMDAVGAVILIAYLVLFVFNKGNIVGHWISNPQEVAATGLAITAGVMLGRTVFTIRAIRGVLEKVGVRPAE